MKLVHGPLMDELLHLVQQGADWTGRQPSQAPPRCTKYNSPPINGQCTTYCYIYIYRTIILLSIRVCRARIGLTLLVIASRKRGNDLLLSQIIRCSAVLIKGLNVNILVVERYTLPAIKQNGRCGQSIDGNTDKVKMKLNHVKG